MSLRFVRNRRRQKCITGKYWYGSELEAKASAFYIAHSLIDRLLRAYRCDKCNGWHLTSKPYAPKTSRPTGPGERGSRMSFSFSGAGPKADVIRQIRSHHSYDTDESAVAVRDFIALLLDGDASRPVHAGGQYVFSVQASGHSGHGSPTSLSLTITPMYVPDLDPEVEVEAALGAHQPAGYGAADILAT